jgi:ABC-type Zn2+ transport system substrate-binding protein/surface adhesin
MSLQISGEDPGTIITMDVKKVVQMEKVLIEIRLSQWGKRMGSLPYNIVPAYTHKHTHSHTHTHPPTHTHTHTHTLTHTHTHTHTHVFLNRGHSFIFRLILMSLWSVWEPTYRLGKKIFTNLTFDTGLISKIYKELKKLTTKNPNYPIKT